MSWDTWDLEGWWGMLRGIAIGTSLALLIVGGASGQAERSRDMQIVPTRPAALTDQPQPTSDGADYNGWEHYDAAKPVTLTGIVMSAGFSRGEDATQTLFVITVDEQRRDQPIHTGWRVVLDTIPALESAGLSLSHFGDRKQVEVSGLAHRVHQRFLRAERVIVDGKTAILRQTKEQ
jgi:hypothetical protein